MAGKPISDKLKKILPHIDADCSKCGLHRARNNVYQGMIIPYTFIGGKCIRPNGFCDGFTRKYSNDPAVLKQIEKGCANEKSSKTRN